MKRNNEKFNLESADLLVYLIILGISAWSIYPIIKSPMTSYFYGGDDALIAWILNQTIQKLPGDLGNIFNTNIFYPYKNTLAYGVMLIPSAMLSYIPVKLTGSHIAAYNLTIIASQFLTVTVLFLWFKELTKDRWAAFIGTLTFALSQIRMLFIVHIHFFIMQWFLISAWMIWKYTQNKKVWQLYLAGLFFVIQVWDNIYLVYFTIFSAAILLLPNLKDLRKDFKHLFRISLLVLILSLPVINAYFSVYREFGFAGSIRESSHFSMSLDDIWKSYLSYGLYLNFLILLFLTKSNVIKKNKDLNWLAFLLIFGIIMALGPVLKWEGETFKLFGRFFVPLPYSLFYYLLPGFSALRSVHRFIWLYAFAVSGMIALLFSILVGKKRIFIGIFLLALAIIGGSRITKTLDFPMPENYPQVYIWLKDQQGDAILEYPVYSWTDKNHGFEMVRMLYSTLHKKSLVNGASGFMPEERSKLLKEISSEYPETGLDQKLKNMGVDYVIFHKDESDNQKIAEFDRDINLKKVREDQKTSVYSLH